MLNNSNKNEVDKKLVNVRTETKSNMNQSFYNRTDEFYNTNYNSSALKSFHGSFHSIGTYDSVHTGNEVSRFR